MPRLCAGARSFLIAGVMLVGTLRGEPFARASIHDGISSAGRELIRETLPSNTSYTAVLTWLPPTQNADGSVFTDLLGYAIHYGTTPGVYSHTIRLTNPGLTAFVVENLAAGTYYFAVTAYNSAGIESALSPEISTRLD